MKPAMSTTALLFPLCHQPPAPPQSISSLSDLLCAQETHLPAVGTEDCLPASSPNAALEAASPSATLFL